jgi:hypothetical protein
MCRSSFFLLAFAIVATPASAAPILYTFTGAEPCVVPFPSCTPLVNNFLAGRFFLDDSTPFTITDFGDGRRAGVLSSPLQTIAGQFGDYTFTGIATLHVADFPSSNDLAFDNWIVRSSITGPTIGGLTPAFLNLLMFTSSSGITDITIQPPSLSPNPGDFQYSFAFSDGSFVSGRLTTLQQVPDTASTFMLLLPALCALGLLRRTRALEIRE